MQDTTPQLSAPLANPKRIRVDSLDEVRPEESVDAPAQETATA